MGKAQVKFILLVGFPDLLNPEVDRLREQGHTIVPAPAHDVYLDSATLAKRTYIDAALKGARARKKGKVNDPVS